MWAFRWGRSWGWRWPLFEDLFSAKLDPRKLLPDANACFDGFSKVYPDRCNKQSVSTTRCLATVLAFIAFERKVQQKHKMELPSVKRLQQNSILENKLFYHFRRKTSCRVSGVNLFRGCNWTWHKSKVFQTKLVRS